MRAGGKPLEGATVRFRPPDDPRPTASARTAADGRALLAGVDLDGVVVEAFAEGYRVRSFESRWRNAASYFEDGVVELELERGIPLLGRVLDARSGLPIAGASVVVRDWSDDLECGPTDATGAFRVPAVMDDHEARLTASAPGHVPAALEVRVDGGKPTPELAVLRLEAGGAAKGVVLSAGGVPVPNATVILVPREGDDHAETGERVESEDQEARLVALFEADDSVWARGTATDQRRAVSEKDGSWRAEGLVFGTSYDVAATARGHAESPVSRGLRTTAESPVATASIRLRREATLRLRIVTEADAELPEDARVRFFRGSMAKPDQREPDGRFRFGSLSPGSGHVFVSAKGYRSTWKRVVVVEGQDLDVDLALEPGATVEGVVVDPEGHPLAGAEVRVAPEARNLRGGRYLEGATKVETDEAGRFRARGIAAGPVVLLAEWGDWDARHWLGTRARVRATAPATGLRIGLAPLGALRVRLLTPDGRPFRGEVWTMLASEDGGYGGSEEVGNGVVEEIRLDEGLYTWKVRPAGFAWFVRSATIENGGTIDLGDVTLEPGVVVSGAVLDGAGRPLEGASVTCVENEDRATRTDAAGRFSMDRFPRAAFSLEVSLEGRSSARVAVEPTRTTGLEVRLLRPGFFEGSVKTFAGAPALDEAVQLRRPDAEKVRRTVIDAATGTEKTVEFYEASVWLGMAEGRPFREEADAGRWVGYWTDDTGVEHRVGEWTLGDGETKKVDIVLPKPK